MEKIIGDLQRSMKHTLQGLSSEGKALEETGYFYRLAEELVEAPYLKRSHDVGKKVVGYFCTLVPEELILAAGAIPVRLCSGWGKLARLADRISSSNLCPVVKSSIGLSLSGVPLFSYCDVVVVPTTCDGKKKLSELLARKIPVWLLEVPSGREAPSARRLWLNQIKLLRQHLGDLTGIKINKKRLKESIELGNRKRALVHQLYRLRGEGKIGCGEALLVTHTSFYADPLKWIDSTTRLCARLEKERGIFTEMEKRPRILLVGSPILLPHLKIPLMVEELGGVIVADDLCSGGKALWDPVWVRAWNKKEMLAGIAERSFTITCPCFTPNVAWMGRLRQLIHESQVEGVIYHSLRGCCLYGLEVWHIREGLEELNIPMLEVESDYSGNGMAQIGVRLEAFLEMLRSRRNGQIYL